MKDLFYKLGIIKIIAIIIIQLFLFTNINIKDGFAFSKEQIFAKVEKGQNLAIETGFDKDFKETRILEKGKNKVKMSEQDKKIIKDIKFLESDTEDKISIKLFYIIGYGFLFLGIILTSIGMVISFFTGLAIVPIIIFGIAFGFFCLSAIAHIFLKFKFITGSDKDYITGDFKANEFYFKVKKALNLYDIKALIGKYKAIDAEFINELIKRIESDPFNSIDKINKLKHEEFEEKLLRYASEDNWKKFNKYKNIGKWLIISLSVILFLINISTLVFILFILPSFIISALIINIIFFSVLIFQILLIVITFYTVFLYWLIKSKKALNLKNFKWNLNANKEKTELKEKRQKVFDQIKRKKIYFYSFISLTLITVLSGIALLILGIIGLSITGFLISGVFIINLIVLIAGSILIILGSIFIFVRLISLYAEYNNIFPGYFDKSGKSSIKDKHEYIYFKTSDNVDLRGIYLRADKSDNPKPPRGVILFSYGNAQSAEYASIHFPYFNMLGFDVFCYDYRGYDKKIKGFISESGIYKDAEASYKKMEKQYEKLYNHELDKKKIILMGYSLGASVANYLAYTKKAGVFISIAGFSSIKSLIMSTFKLEKFCPKFLLKFLGFLIDISTLNTFNSAGRISDINMPKFIIYSKSDKLIPKQEHDNLVKESKKDKKNSIEEKLIEENIVVNNGILNKKSKFKKFIRKIFKLKMERTAKKIDHEDILNYVLCIDKISIKKFLDKNFVLVWKNEMLQRELEKIFYLENKKEDEIQKKYNSIIKSKNELEEKIDNMQENKILTNEIKLRKKMFIKEIFKFYNKSKKKPTNGLLYEYYNFVENLNEYQNKFLKNEKMDIKELAQLIEYFKLKFLKDILSLALVKKDISLLLKGDYNNRFERLKEKIKDKRKAFNNFIIDFYDIENIQISKENLLRFANDKNNPLIDFNDLKNLKISKTKLLKFEQNLNKLIKTSV